MLLRQEKDCERVELRHEREFHPCVDHNIGVRDFLRPWFDPPATVKSTSVNPPTSRSARLFA